LLVSKFEVNKARDYIYRRDNNTCCKCRLKFKKNTETKKNIDHIIPRSVFAWSHPFNLQLLCQPCNKEKSDILLEDTYDIIERTITRTAEVFLYVWPSKVPKSKKEQVKRITDRLLKEKFEFMSMVYFNFLEAFDILTLYYEDDQINERLGISLARHDYNEMIDDFYNIFKGKLESVCNYANECAYNALSNSDSRYVIRSLFRELVKTYDAIAFRLARIGMEEMSAYFRKEAFHYSDI